MIIEFLGEEFVHSYAKVVNLESHLVSSMHLSPATPLEDRFREETSADLQSFANRCDALDLRASVAVARGAVMLLKPDPLPVQPGVLLGRVTALRHAIVAELSEVRFASVPFEKVRYFAQADLFGLSVSAAFPEAKEDIKDGGDALALGLDTAAVFHLMRVAELGLRALAKKARVTVKKTPIDWADARALIEAIRKKKVVPIEAKHRGPKKDAELEFWRGALGEAEAFKDAYRNPVMHARRRFNEFEAANILVHVRAFMQRLAT